MSTLFSLLLTLGIEDLEKQKKSLVLLVGMNTTSLGKEDNVFKRKLYSNSQGEVDLRKEFDAILFGTDG